MHQRVTRGKRASNSRPTVIVLSERAAQFYEPTLREACISITGPTRPVPLLSDRFHAVLRIAFSDVTEQTDLPGYLLFNEHHAETILRFARGCHDLDRVVIHCQAGLSRSPGVAMALCELFGWSGASADWEKSHPLLNTWVRKELIRVGRATLPQDS
jgi:predicted protein tyrosine phosphatase